MYEYAIKKNVNSDDDTLSVVLEHTIYETYDKAYDATYHFYDDGRGYDGYNVSNLEEAKRLVSQLELAARTTYTVVRRPLPVDWEECYE